MTKHMTCDIKELPRVAGEVLRGDPKLNHQELSNGICLKCGSRCGDADWKVECVPMSISLTWDNAMKWQDWAIKEYGLAAYADVLVSMGFKHMFDMIILTEAQRIRATCQCKINSEKGSE